MKIVRCPTCTYDERNFLINWKQFVLLKMEKYVSNNFRTISSLRNRVIEKIEILSLLENGPWIHWMCILSPFLIIFATCMQGIFHD